MVQGPFISFFPVWKGTSNTVKLYVGRRSTGLTFDSLVKLLTFDLINPLLKLLMSLLATGLPLNKVKFDPVTEPALN